MQPAALLALGSVAARSLTGRPVAVMSERGHWIVRDSDGREVLITLHPSALLRLRGADRDTAYALWLRDLAHATRFVHADGPPLGATPGK